MTVKEDNINLLLLSRLLATNEFSNILKQSSEFDNQEEFIAMKSCFTQMEAERLAVLSEQYAGSLLQEMPYVKESPCLQSNISSACQYFCDWSAIALQKITKEELLVLMR